MSGYIKFHRDIREHWIWNNPKYFRAWCWLLCEAAWEEKEIPVSGDTVIKINRGQILTSIRKLMGFFEYYAESTLKFLNLLEDQGMISRTSYAKNTIITITNFEKYQSLDDEKDSDEERKSEQTPKQLSKRHIRNKEINNILSHRARTREEENFYKEFFEQDIFFSELAASRGLDLNKLKMLAEKFKSDMMLQEKYHESLKDLKQHFFSWLNIQIQMEQKQKNNNSNGNNKQFNNNSGDKYASRKGNTSINHAPEDYGGAF